jgi:hypothetical protein
MPGHSTCINRNLSANEKVGHLQFRYRQVSLYLLLLSFEERII